MSYQTLESSDAAVSVILKLRGQTCDVDCLYCFEKRKEAPGGARISADHVGRLARLFRGRPLAVELHGGEPLTAGREHIASVLAALAAEPSVIQVSMQTNGVRLDDEWLDLFDELYPGLRIGISLDGDATGNAWRIGYDGQPIYPKVVNALELLGERGKHVGIIAVVTPQMLGRAEAVLEHLAGFSAVNTVSFIPCFDSSVSRATSTTGRTTASRALQRLAFKNGIPAWAIRPHEYAEFVLAAAAHWVRTGLHTKIKLEPAVSVIRRLRGLDTAFCHFSDLKCDHVFTLYPDGRFGGCDELPWPDAGLGTLDDGLDVADAQRTLPLLSQGRSLMTRCASCTYRSTCGGGCISTRLRYVQADDEDAYCASRMRLVDGIAALITQPERLEAVWCRTMRWRPRDPNQMNDVGGFMDRWDDPAAPRPLVTVRESPHGNLNTVGEPGIHEAPDLDPLHPQWREAIEPGVRPLVDVCTSVLGLITYDSCAGHHYKGTGLVPIGRRVGILPRNRGEYAETGTLLCRAVLSVKAEFPSSVSVAVGRSELFCRSSNDAYPVLDLLLEPAPSTSWDEYFAEVDQATDLLSKALRAERGAGGRECGCRPEITR